MLLNSLSTNSLSLSQLSLHLAAVVEVARQFGLVTIAVAEARDHRGDQGSQPPVLMAVTPP